MMLSPILRKTDFILKWDPRRLGSFCRLARLYAEYTSFSAGLKRRVFALEKPITNCTLLDTDRPATIPNPHLLSHAPTPHGQSPNPQTTIVPSNGQSESLIEQTLQPSVGSEAISWKSSLPQFDDPSTELRQQAIVPPLAGGPSAEHMSSEQVPFPGKGSIPDWPLSSLNRS